MLTLGIQYLTGCAVASDVDDRSHVEWPPHPGRVFMALAARIFKRERSIGTRRAGMAGTGHGASNLCSRVQRACRSHAFVPVNDVAGPATAPIQSALGFSRKRQPREFAKASIDERACSCYWRKPSRSSTSVHWRACAER